MARRDWADLNETELAMVAAEWHPEAHKGYPRALLIEVIEKASVELPASTLHKKRLRIMRYIDDCWSAVSALISCPAKTRDPYACFGCSDNQVSSCTLENRSKFLDQEERKNDDDHGVERAG